MKKFLSVFLSLVLLINILPLGAAIADTQYVEVTADSAPIRNDYYETGDALQWVSPVGIQGYYAQGHQDQDEHVLQ